MSVTSPNGQLRHPRVRAALICCRPLTCWNACLKTEIISHKRKTFESASEIICLLQDITNLLCTVVASLTSGIPNKMFVPVSLVRALFENMFDMVDVVSALDMYVAG
jgi:hypothetical protein